MFLLAWDKLIQYMIHDDVDVMPLGHQPPAADISEFLGEDKQVVTHAEGQCLESLMLLLMNL